MEEKEYNELVDMFATPGWKSFIKGADELEKALTENAVHNATTSESWQQLRGQVLQLRSLLSYEDFIVEGWKAKLEEDKKALFEVEPDVNSI